MDRKYLITALVIGILGIALIIGLSRVDIDVLLSSKDETPTVRINDARFVVEVADTERLRSRGLAGRQFLEERKGMLYIPDGPEAGSHWMKGMLFPLDFIWIDGDCRVVDLAIDARVPARGTPDEELPRFISYPPAAYTLEVNAGEIDRFRIRVGDRARFENIDGHC